MQAIDEYYMTREMHTMTFVLNKAIHLVQQENSRRPKHLNLPYPTISTMRSVLKGYSESEIFSSRRGSEAARNKYRTSIGQSLAEGPLDVVEIDHTRLDIVAVDELTGLPIDRPWLTTLICRFSKCVIGYRLSFEPPSHATVAAALKHGILPKILHETTQGQWPIHGIPTLLVVDNGLEFHGQALKELCAEIGMSISFCPRKKGWAKGSIERFLGTLNRNVSELVPSGRTFHSIQERGDYDSVAKASVSLEALRICIERYIVDIYHETFHRGIKCKPIEKWNVYINYEELRLPVDPSEFDAISGNIETRKVFHYGIEINNATYNSDELMKHRDSFSKGSATVRWNSQDLGHIHVMIPNGPRIEVPVQASKSYLKGMSYYVWKVIQSDLKASQVDIEDKIAVANRIHEITGFMEANAKKNKQTRLRHMRFRDGSRQALQSVNVTQSEVAEQLVLKTTSEQIVVPKMTISERRGIRD